MYTYSPIVELLLANTLALSLLDANTMFLRSDSNNGLRVLHSSLSLSIYIYIHICLHLIPSAFLSSPVMLSIGHTIQTREFIPSDRGFLFSSGFKIEKALGMWRHYLCTSVGNLRSAFSSPCSSPVPAQLAIGKVQPL